MMAKSPAAIAGDAGLRISNSARSTALPCRTKAWPVPAPDQQHAMLSRQDDENILMMFSDNIHFA
jgi:predicted nucleic acid-binding Zn ribbon protein